MNKSKAKIADEAIKKHDAKILRIYNVPSLGVSVEAKSPADAVEKANKNLKPKLENHD